MDQKNKIQYLLKAWSNRTISAEEEKELAAWVKETRDWSEFYAYVDRLVEQYDPKEFDQQVDWEILFDKIQTTKRARRKKNEVPFNKSKSIFMRPWLKWAVAAVLLPAISIIAISLFQTLYKSQLNNLQYADVKAPVSNKAFVTLSDGRTVYIDSLQNGLYADGEEVNLVKISEEQIAYQSVSSDKSHIIRYNTLTNPKGSKVIDLELSDGSHVWLNSESSITFPVAFIGNFRKVSITGEAYFEVAHDTSKPFFVTKGNMNIKVLGTHFNVKAYDDDKDIKVTLLEGSIDVSNVNEHLLIKPGQQAVIGTESNITLTENIDTDQVMAWKNGVFQFNNTPIEDALKQLARWYDVEIIYEGKTPDIELWGEIKRDLTLSQSLRGLGKMGVKYKIEEGKIIIMP